MSPLQIVSVADGSDSFGPQIDESSSVVIAHSTPDTFIADVASTHSEWICIANPAVRFTADGLARTLHAISEPSIVTVADGLIHRNVFVLLEGNPTVSREVYRLTLGDTAKGPSPTVVLGGAMTQPGALVVRAQWLRDNASAIIADTAIEMVEKATRLLGQSGRLMVMPWILSERVAIRTPESLELGDALGIDPRYQSAMSELWRHAWADVEAASADHIRLVHGVVAPTRTVAQRIVGRLRRMVPSR